jgi:hypothetical protein
MSSSFTRILRKLYPRPVRERYGDELLGLQDELRARGEISRAGLLRDAIVGATLARSRRQRASLTLAVGAVVAALVTAGVVLGSAGLTPAHPPTLIPKRLIGTVFATPEPYHSCFTTTSGSSCSQVACTEFVELNPVTGQVLAQRAMRADRHATQGKCTGSPPPAVVVPVGKHAAR